MITLRYAGLELPIIEPGVPLLENAAEFRAAALAGETSFVRALYFCAPESWNLRHVLRCTDEEMRRLAELCQAEVVPHQWALWRFDSRNESLLNSASTQRHVRPQDYMVVASVEVVPEAEPIEDDGPVPEAIVTGLRNYLETAEQGRPYRLMDTAARQFVIATQTNTPTYVDLDPLLWTA